MQYEYFEPCNARIRSYSRSDQGTRCIQPTREISEAHVHLTTNAENATFVCFCFFCVTMYSLKNCRRISIVQYYACTFSFLHALYCAYSVASLIILYFPGMKLHTTNSIVCEPWSVHVSLLQCYEHFPDYTRILIIIKPMSPIN